MLIQDPPVSISEKLCMLGTNAYPLYLYRGDSGATIFEGGVGAMGPVVQQQLEQLGVRNDLIRQVVVTHAHPDHVMAIPLFRELFPGALVLASEAAAKTLSVEKAVAFFAKMDNAVTDWLVASHQISDSQRPAPLKQNQIAIDQQLREGSQVEVDDGVAFRVLETPGHSACSLSFYEPVSRTLIISDATGYYMPQDNTWWPNYFVDYGAYVHSIERLSAIDAEVVCLSHNAAIRGTDAVADYFRNALTATQQYHQRIVDLIRSGTSAEDIASVLGAEIHAKTGQMNVDFFCKNCVLLVKRSLAHEGLDT